MLCFIVKAYTFVGTAGNTSGGGRRVKFDSKAASELAVVAFF